LISIWPERQEMNSKKQRILFVDDEEQVLNGLRRILHHQSKVWNMEFVISGDEALDKMLQTDFDAVVSDVSMPGRSGFELLQIIRNRKQTKDVPVIILTGLNERALKRQALDLGATDLLNNRNNQLPQKRRAA
jgi:CheY-like chemotaxis protein